MATDARLHVNPTGDLLEAARDCEADVFWQWYRNTREEMEREYGPYEDRSVFLAVTDAHDDVTAVMRLIAPGGPAGLKTLTDVNAEPWNVDGRRAAMAAGLDLSTTWEIATLGSRRRQAASSIRNSMALYFGFGVLARVNAMSAFVAILDDRVRRLLDMVGLATLPLPGTRAGAYLGSAASTPVYGVTSTMADNQRRDHPDAFALIAMGHGLDGVSVPTDEEFLLFGRTEVASRSWLTPRSFVGTVSLPVAVES